MIIYIYREDIFYKENPEEEIKIRPLSYLKKFNKRMITGVIVLEDQPANLFISNDKKGIEHKIKQLKNKFLIATLESKGLYYCAAIRKNKLSEYKIRSGKFPLLAVYPVNLLLADKIEDGVLICNLDEKKRRYDYYENFKLVHSQIADEDEQDQVEFYLKRNNIISRSKQKILAYGNQGLVETYEKYCQLLMDNSQESPADSSFIGFNHIQSGSRIKNRYLFLLILMLVIAGMTLIKYLNYYNLNKETKINRTIWQQIENEYYRVKEIETDMDSFNNIISNNVMFFGKLFTRQYPFKGAVITRSFYHKEQKVMEIQGYTAQNFDTFLNSLNSRFDNVQLISSYYQREVNLFKIMIHLGENYDQ